MGVRVSTARSRTRGAHGPHIGELDWLMLAVLALLTLMSGTAITNQAYASLGIGLGTMWSGNIGLILLLSSLYWLIRRN